MLPGIGSYIAVAIQQKNLTAIYWAIATMAVQILIYDQLLFRPLVAWADRFRPEQQGSAAPPSAWVLTVFRRSALAKRASEPLARLWNAGFRVGGPRPVGSKPPRQVATLRRIADGIWLAAVGGVMVYTLWATVHFIAPSLGHHELLHALLLVLITGLRVVLLIAIASVIWVPAGILIGLRPDLMRIVQPLAQFLAAFPANLLFPLAVMSIVALNLHPDIWLSPLMILGTQWYILFNVIAGAAVIPGELLDVGANLRVGGWRWWRRIALPAVFPYYVTGAITASGGCLNASIVAEAVSWGDTHLEAHGIGAYIANATANGDFQRIVLGIVVMSAFVVVLNRLFWRPLYQQAERRFRLD
jgi:NitT/TauT family transport system permease protein